MGTLIDFLIFIGILVFVHEFGHFLIAKLVGVKVETFSIGFGPPIFRKKLGETVYQIALIPLGGYVKLYGEEDSEEARKDPRSFYAKPPWQRILIALGGPLFNILFAILAFWIYFVAPHKIAVYPAKVGYVAQNSTLAHYDVKPGYKIVSVNGKPVKDWNQFAEILRKESFGKGVEITFQTPQGRKITVKLNHKQLEKGLGIAPYLPPVVGGVLKGKPAEQVGIKEGDRIVEINGKKVSSWYDITEYMSHYGGNGALKLTIERNRKLITVEVIPEKKGNRYLLGIEAKTPSTKVIRYSPLEALKLAVKRTWELSVLTVKAIWMLITGQLSIHTLGGPLAIAGLAHQAAQMGILTFINMMGVLSVQLALFNLIPLPLLDGGLILLFLIEWIRGKPLPERFKEWWVKVGLVIIGGLMLFIVMQDLIRFITSGKLIPPAR
jgi:regulator of sigma E protease